MTQESTPLPLGAILDRNGKPVRRANPDGAHPLTGASDLIGCLIMTATGMCR
mgnify:CR=1 FL=1